MQENLDGPKRRRRWSDAEKIGIVVEAAAPDVTVAEISLEIALYKGRVLRVPANMAPAALTVLIKAAEVA